MYRVRTSISATNLQSLAKSPAVIQSRVLTMGEVPSAVSCFVWSVRINRASGQLFHRYSVRQRDYSTGAEIPNANVFSPKHKQTFTRTTTDNVRRIPRPVFAGRPYTVKVRCGRVPATLQSGSVLLHGAAGDAELLTSAWYSEYRTRVTAEVPQINLGDSVLGRTVDNREIENLPLVGRNVYDFTKLTPGVQNVPRTRLHPASP